MGQLKPPTELRNKILLSIRQEEIRRARIYLMISFGSALASVAGIAWSTRYLINGFSHSNFYSYFSLLFSDPDVLLSYWKEISLSLAETFPFLGITLLLVAVVLFLWSVRVMAQNMREGFTFSFNN